MRKKKHQYELDCQCLVYILVLTALCMLPMHGITETQENLYDTWCAARGENGLYGYIDRQGQWMINPNYVFADFHFTGNYIRAGMDELPFQTQQGVINRQGDWVLPPEYS